MIEQRSRLPTTPTIVGLLALVATGIFGLAAAIVASGTRDRAFALFLGAMALLSLSAAVLAGLAAMQKRAGDRTRFLRRATDLTAQVLIFVRARWLLRMLGLPVPDDLDGPLYDVSVPEPWLRYLPIAAIVITAGVATLVAIEAVGYLGMLAGLLPALVTAVIALHEEERARRDNHPADRTRDVLAAEAALRATAVLWTATLLAWPLFVLIAWASGGINDAAQ